MSDNLVQSWRDRLVEVEAEIEVVEEEIAGVERQKAELKRDIGKYEASIENDRALMKKKITDVENRAITAASQLEEAEKLKVRLEQKFAETVAEYDSLHEVVEKLKQQESEVENRPNYEATLREESEAWFREEEFLRRKLQQMEAEVAEAKQQTRSHREQSDSIIKELELQLHSDRMGREKSVPQRTQAQQRSVSRSDVSGKAGSRKRDLLGDVTNQ